MNNQDIADNFTACPACQNIFSIEHEIGPAIARQKKEDEEVIRWLLESHYFELDYQKAELIKEIMKPKNRELNLGVIDQNIERLNKNH